MNNRKVFDIRRGASVHPLKLNNGDIYDGQGVLYGPDGAEIWRTDMINTDPSVRFAGRRGILAPGLYLAFKGRRYNPASGAWDGKKTVRLAREDTDLTKCPRFDYLTDRDVLLPSTVPNPNRGGRKEISGSELHGGGGETWSWDYSEGCLTMPNTGGYNEFDVFYNILGLNEVFYVKLS